MEQQQKKRASFTLSPELFKMLEGLGRGNMSQTVEEALKVYFYANAGSSEKQYVLNSKLLELMHQEEVIEHEILYYEQEQSRIEKKLELARQKVADIQDQRKKIEDEIASLQRYHAVEERELRELAVSTLRRSEDLNPSSAAEKYDYAIRRELDNKLIPKTAILKAFEYASEVVKKEREEEEERRRIEMEERRSRVKRTYIKLNDTEKRLLKPMQNYYKGEQYLKRNGLEFCKTPEEYLEKYKYSLPGLKDKYEATQENVERVARYLYQFERSR